MPEPPGDYEDFLFDADALLAQVKLYRGLVGAAARGGKGVEALLVLLLPDLEELLGEVRGVLTGAERGRQKVGRPEPPGGDPDPGFRTGLRPPRGKLLWLIIRFAAVGDATALGSLPGLLPDLEQLLGAVEAAMTQRN
jgi:hypothetical protein